MTLALAVLIGLAVGLANGGLGAGASVLAIPALLFPLHQPPRAAVGGSLVAVGIASLAGLAAHARAGRVHWGAGLAFGVLGVGGAVAGSHLSRAISPRLLLLGFSLLLLVVAAAMAAGGGSDGWRRSHRAAAGGPHPRRTAGVLLVTASAVGLLTGLLGVGGGFVVVPALTLLLGFPLTEAIGTSLLVITLNSAVALVSRGVGAPDPLVVIPFTAGAVVGTLVGSRVGGLLPTVRLRQAFALLLVGVGLWVGVEAVRGVATPS